MDVKGTNWSFENGVYDIFGARGYVDGSKWVIPTGFGSLLAEVGPEPISDEIRQIIAGDVEAGNGDKIAYVGVSPRWGLLLVLEGVITVEYLQTAEETSDRIMCTVRFDGRERKFVILKDATDDAATYDSNDEVV